VQITYYSLGGGTDRVIVLANGLGGRFYVWEPLVEKVRAEYRIITWDYRGLFESGAPSRIRRLAIPNHAEDIVRILDNEGIPRASIIGWSMGVQVALEFASIYPERLDRLILINGTHGHALETGFQPMVRIPWLSGYLHEVIEFVRRRPVLIEWLSRLMLTRSVVGPVGSIYSWLRGNDKIKYALFQYLEDVFGTDFTNYMRLFQELDAHSTYHHLREIPHPTLVIWGSLDYLTPAYQSREMVRKMPNARALNFLLGTHFVLLEYPEEVTAEIATFLDEHGD
jgi:pimeloyl-ACP methyl ester carboxylesterase